jgi:hypothetical protein
MKWIVGRKLCGTLKMTKYIGLPRSVNHSLMITRRRMFLIAKIYTLYLALYTYDV